MSITNMMKMVRSFHDRFGYPNSVEQTHLSGDVALTELQIALRDLVRRYQEEANNLCLLQDPRLYRALSHIEESGVEFCVAARSGNRVKVADALGDALYFLLGTAVMYDIPLDTVFAEIHASNMTKQRTDFRLRDKGSDYRPPDLQRVLDEYDLEKRNATV